MTSDCVIPEIGTRYYCLSEALIQYSDPRFPTVVANFTEVGICNEDERFFKLREIQKINVK